MSLKISIKPLVLTGPSGSGRAAIAFRLISCLSHKFQRVISHTTRKPRPMEKDATHFYFVNQNQVDSMNTQGQFLTLINSPHDHSYGLTRRQLQRALSINKIPIFKVTLDAYIRNILGRVDCNSLYIELSDLKELKKRLHYGPFSDKEVEEKIQQAQQQMKEARKYFPEQDIIQNHNIQEALLKVKGRLFQLY